MADVVIRVTGQDSSASATDKAADGIERIGDEAKKATPKLGELDAAERAAGRGANQMGDQFDKSKRDAAQLMARIAELSASTKMLALDFGKGSQSGDELTKTFNKQFRELNQLRRMAKAAGLGDDPSVRRTLPVKVVKDLAEESSGTFKSVFEGGIIQTFQGLPSEAKAAIAASAGALALALAAPLITTVNSLLLAGIGGGVLFAGIKLAAKDPAVASAFSDLGDTISQRLDRSVEPFKAKLIDSADVFGRAFEDEAPRIDSIFGGLAEEIKPLAHGLADGFKNAMPGLQQAVAASRPLIRDFANELPKIGKLIGDVFSSLAKAGPGLELAFKFVLVSVEALIKSFQILIDLISPIPNFIALVGNALGTWDIGRQEDLVTVLTDLRSGTDDAASGFSEVASQMYNTADAAKELDQRFNDLFQTMLSQDEAELAVQQGWADLTKELQNGKRSLDESTQAGRDNVRSIFDQIDALNRKREADIAAGDGTKEATETANRAYAGQIESLRRLLYQLGFNKAEVEALIGAYQNIPHEIDTTINTYHNDYYARLGAGGTAFDAGAREDRRYGKMSGGIVGAAQLGGIHSGMTKVGEGGYEYARLPSGTMVYPHANSAQMDAMAANSGAGMGGINIALVSSGGSDALVEIINTLIARGALRLKVVNSRVVPA